MNSTVDIVVTALVPAQTIVSEALIVLYNGMFNGCFTNANVFREGAWFTVFATFPTLAATLCVCNLVLSINKLQKIIGSTALIIQAGITATAQMKNINDESKGNQTKQGNIEQATDLLSGIPDLPSVPPAPGNTPSH